MRPHAIAVCNQKGGVGKSTTTFHLARAAARKGIATLVVDADPQGNLTAVLAAEPTRPDQPGLADVLSTRTPDGIDDVLVATPWDGVDLAPTSGQSLASVRDELVIAGAGREARLKTSLARTNRAYDLVLIDCPPSLDQLTINALAAADDILIVTEAKLWSTDGLSGLLETTQAVRTHYNPGLSVAGVLVNRYEPRTLGGQHWLTELQQATTNRGIRLLDPPIPKRALIADATEAGQGLDQWGGPDADSLATLYAGHLATIREPR